MDRRRLGQTGRAGRPGGDEEEAVNDRIRIGTAITAAAATLVLVGSAVAQAGEQPHGVSAQQSAGDLARGDALNKRYHLGKYTPAAQAGPKPAGMTKRQWQAEVARGDALNRRYGLGAYADSTGTPAVNTPAPPRVVAVASDGFDWGSAGIGAGAAIGIGLLAGGMVMGLRHARRAHPTPST
jgi:hypothetical protein